MMNEKKREKILDLILPVTAILCLIIIWSVAAKGVDSEIVLPSVKNTLSAFFDLLTMGEFYASFFFTLLRSLISFTLSFILAFIVAVISKRHKRAERFFAPIISVIRALPTVAVVLLLLLWTNYFIAPIIVTSLVIFPTLYVNVKNSLDSVDENHLEMCRVFGVSNKDIFFKVQLPCILPPIIKATGSGISLNIKLMVAAEVLASTSKSLGGMLNISKLDLETATMLALVLVAVITGLIVEGVFSFFYKRAVRR